MSLGFVYMITSPSGRIYIGSTTDPKKRFSYYLRLDCKNQIKLYRSFIKYGVESHVFEIIWEGDLSKMLFYEYLCGVYFQCISKGLNCQLPKFGDSYTSTSLETRSRMSSSRIGMVFSEQHKLNLSLSKKGKKGPSPSKETRLKLSLANKGRVVLEETKDKLRSHFKGRNLSKEHKENIKIGLWRRYNKIIIND